MRISLVALLLLEGVPRALSFGVSSQSNISQGPGDFTSLRLYFLCQFWGLSLHAMSNTDSELTTLCCTSLELWFAVGNHDLLSTVSQNWHRASCWFSGGWLGKFFHLLVMRRVALWGFWLSSEVLGLSRSICYTHIVHEPQLPTWRAYTHLPFPMSCCGVSFHLQLWFRVPTLFLEPAPFLVFLLILVMH